MNNPFDTPETLDLLDKNDKIRAIIGMSNKDFQNLLPSIVVVGAQSHGKSSVLEAASEIKLPAGSGMVTKRPLVMQLRKGRRESIKFQATFGQQETDISTDEVCQAVVAETARSDEEQKEEGNLTGIVDQPMTLRIESESSPNVTMIDLPGIKYDTKDAGERIKSMIRTYIQPKSAIILVVHNATVDADTNQGFELAAKVDEKGLRTLCVLTHVDMVSDPADMEANVIRKLNDPNITYVAVRNPSTSEHETITFANAHQKEQEYFATNSMIDSRIYRDRTGIKALLKRIETLYCQAVLDSQVPLRKKLFEERAKYEKELVQFPDVISPQVEFTQIWLQAANTIEKVVKFPSDDLTVKREIHQCCETIAQRLDQIPDAYLKPHNGRYSLVKLVECLEISGGIMLPNFTPYDPIEEFIRYNVARHAQLAIGFLRRKMEEQLALIAKEVMNRVRNEKGSNLIYGPCFMLIEDELTGVMSKLSKKFDDRMKEICVDECSSIWTVNTSLYISGLEDDNDDNRIDDQQLFDAFGGNEYVQELLQSRESLKEQTKVYFRTFASYWRVFVTTFVDGIGKCALRILNDLMSAMIAHHKDVQHDVIERAFSTVTALVKKRDALRVKLTELEQAQMLLDGKVTPIPYSIVNDRDLKHKNDKETPSDDGLDLFDH